ncbi:MAG: MoxR family ATPase [Endomicrobia bacterium]|nr:MoxR family ATPase [Endomicrobiia bacterium]
MLKSLLKKEGISAYKDKLIKTGYVPTEEVLNASYYAIIYNTPLLVEGERGSGKTRLAESIAEAFNLDFFFIACYAGIGKKELIGEWNSELQKLAIQRKKNHLSEECFDAGIITKTIQYCLENNKTAILCIDEIDKLEPKDESILLEFLGRGSVTIPILNKRLKINLKDEISPIIIATSNDSYLTDVKTKLSSPLRSRFAYCFVKAPSFQQIIEIIANKYKDFFLEKQHLLKQIAIIVNFFNYEIYLQEKPSIREYIELVYRIVEEKIEYIDTNFLSKHISILAKTVKDTQTIQERLDFLKNEIDNASIAQSGENYEQIIGKILYEIYLRQTTPALNLSSIY